jgi:hypothetical protein
MFGFWTGTKIPESGHTVPAGSRRRAGAFAAPAVFAAGPVPLARSSADRPVFAVFAVLAVFTVFAVLAVFAARAVRPVAAVFAAGAFRAGFDPLAVLAAAPAAGVRAAPVAFEVLTGLAVLPVRVARAGAEPAAFPARSSPAVRARPEVAAALAPDRPAPASGLPRPVLGREADAAP